MIRLFSRLALLTVFGSIVGVAPFASAAENDVIKELSIADTERILESLKLEFKEVGQGTYRFEIGGYKTLLFNKGKNLQFYAGFKKKVTLSRINEWNASKRYTRAYADKEGDPVLEADIDLEGGVTYGAITEFFKTWVTSVKLFTQHIDFKG